VPRKIKIAWDISHLEFTIEDHYYFSILKSEIKRSGAVVKEVDSLKDIIKYDVAVLNYPEKPFTRMEAKLINRYLEGGNKVIITGYYNNEDRIADRINTLSRDFGLSLNKDQIRDKLNNEDGDQLLVVTSRVSSYNDSVSRVFLPCAASVSIKGTRVTPIILREKSRYSRRETVIAAEVKVGEGVFILLGTCVFWDNFAIRKYDNLRFSLNLLLG